MGHAYGLAPRYGFTLLLYGITAALATVPDGPECVHPDIARGDHVELAVPAQGRGPG